MEDRNNRGYDIAKLFSNKFTMVSPTWYQIKPAVTPGSQRLSYSIGGKQDVDRGWITQVRTAAATQQQTGEDGSTSDKGKQKAPKIVPRFLFDGFGRGITSRTTIVVLNTKSYRLIP